MRIIVSDTPVSLREAPPGIILSDYGLYLKEVHPDGRPWQTRRLDGKYDETIYNAWITDPRPDKPRPDHAKGTEWCDEIMVWPARIEE